MITNSKDLRVVVQVGMNKVFKYRIIIYKYQTIMTKVTQVGFNKVYVCKKIAI